MKVKLRSLFIVLALIAGVHPGLAQSTLSIAPSTNRVVLSWLATATNNILQSTTNLTSPNWVTVSNPVPVTVSNAITVTFTNTLFVRFFRLYNTNSFPSPAGMALIPAGSFTIGDTLDGESDAKPTNVTVSAFYIDVNLVSLSVWQGVYTYATSHGYHFDYAGGGNGANYPVETVDWYDCVKWCNARSQQEGLTPVYYTDTGLTHIYTNGAVDITNADVNWSANGYRLPTEAEWEKAARGGVNGLRFPLGDTISESQANYDADPNPPNSGGNTYDLGPYTGYNTNFDSNTYATSPVGFFARNAYGLYDMGGNLEEWCWDWYSVPPYLPGSAYLGGSDPRGPISQIQPEGTLADRVFRGGSWAESASFLRCAHRSTDFPGGQGQVGFRCVKISQTGGGNP